jgi:GNAT superfamily N-acetyltransferase
MEPPRQIRAADPLGAFACGQPSMDEWLVKHALRAEREKTATTYVVIDDGHLAAYYSLAAHSVVRASIGGGRLARNAPDHVPALLLARLAVDLDWQGRHLGSSLLAHAVTLARAVGSMVGLRAIVVDPIDDAAAAFYARYGFRPFPSGTGRMFYPL